MTDPNTGTDGDVGYLVDLDHDADGVVADEFEPVDDALDYGGDREEWTHTEDREERTLTEEAERATTDTGSDRPVLWIRAADEIPNGEVQHIAEDVDDILGDDYNVVVAKDDLTPLSEAEVRAQIRGLFREAFGIDLPETDDVEAAIREGDVDVDSEASPGRLSYDEVDDLYRRGSDDE